MNKEKVVRNARAVMRRMFPDQQERSGGCLFLAYCVIASLHVEGVRAKLQAGTCFWPRLTPEQEAADPDPIVTFGYKWEPNSWQTKWYIQNNMLPEMHVWAVIPDTIEIIDLTSGEWPAQCQKIIQIDWPGPKPPDYFWCSPGPDWPKGVQYHADKRAIQLASMYLQSVLDERGSDGTQASAAQRRLL